MLPLQDAHKCETRRIIDKAVAKTLDMDPELIKHWRQLLSREPTITNRTTKE